uniref:Uncharacterized protein n=1 Tax=Arundo donax TaxID=35708 RepID=A0A0A8ZZU2_ARUDO
MKLCLHSVKLSL